MNVVQGQEVFPMSSIYSLYPEHSLGERSTGNASPDRGYNHDRLPWKWDTARPSPPDSFRTYQYHTTWQATTDP